MSTDSDRNAPLEGPRLDLDRLLEQLIVRAEEVRGARQRLHRLLQANRAVVEELDLRTVLHRVLNAAVDLVGARYGAVAVLDDDGSVAEFIYVGMDDETVAKIGHVPEGCGLLGVLSDEERPLRLRSVTDDPRSTGFPAGHPKMTSFLGVPIRVRGETYGNLYLTEQRDGQFSADDEELVDALAATAGVAIANARLFEHSRHRERWTAASGRVTHELLARDRSDPLALIAERVLDLASADLVTVILPSPSDPETLEVRRAIGLCADDVLTARLARHGSLVGRALVAEQAELINDISDGSVETYLPPGRFGPAMAIPLLTSNGTEGALSVVRERGTARFTEFDLDVADSFAAQIAVALELADAQRDKSRVALLEDRERIARDLHDHVVQRLFAAGLTLQSVCLALGRDEQADRIQRQVDEIDSTIRQIRTSIFALRTDSRDDSTQHLRARVLKLSESATAGLKSAPRVTFRGPVDALVPDHMYTDVLAVLREGLSNVSRHADASTVDIMIETTGERVTVEVVDDGVGVPADASRSGLANLSDRATGLDGTCEITENHPHGTSLRWSVPLEAGDR